MSTHPSIISNNIIEFISNNNDTENFSSFLKNIGCSKHSSDSPFTAFSVGHFPHTPTIKEVIEVLHEHHNLPQIMLIHFMFMRDVYPFFTFEEEMQENAKQFGYEGDLKKQIELNNKLDIGKYLYNYIKMAPHLYTDRGRGPFQYSLSNRTGICVLSEDREKFPALATSWSPDCISQTADLNSPYVNHLAEQDIPYVAGPSGMTSIFSALMLIFGQFNTIEQHNYYILAIMAFITGGGLHSIHEVLTVPHVRLGLLKAYRPFGNKAGNYNDFFTLFNDDTVQANIKNAWDSTIQWLSEHYPTLVHAEDQQKNPTPPETPYSPYVNNI